MKKVLKKNWSDATCKVFCHGEQTHADLVAKEAVYDVEVRENAYMTIAVTAFVTPAKQHVWMGPKQDLYIETASGIVGLRMRQGGTILWCESLAAKTKDKQKERGKKTDHSKLFDKDITGAELYEGQTGGERKHVEKKLTDLTQKVSPWFFSETVASSRSGVANIVGATIKRNQLKLDMTNPTGEFKATVWINVKSKHAVKALENKDQYRNP